MTTGCDAGFVANTKKAVYKMKTVYKIVYKTDDKRLSSLFAPPPYSVNYHVGEWATAPVGGLLAFKTLKQAKAYRFGERKEIWAASAEEPVPLPRWAATSSLVYRQCWADEALEPVFRQIWPDGTVAYRRIRLNRLVCSRGV